MTKIEQNMTFLNKNTPCRETKRIKLEAIFAPFIGKKGLFVDFLSIRKQVYLLLTKFFS